MKSGKFDAFIEEVLSTRTPSSIPNRNASYLEAAVLIPIFENNGEYKLLFTKRTDGVEHHKGQISFPGGAVDKGDATFKETALREADEEIGLLGNDVKILGQIDDTLTVVSRFIIHPFVGLIPHPYDFKINSKEVKRLIKVPFNLFLEDISMNKMDSIEFEGTTYPTPAYDYNGDLIWGATARIMENFLDILGEKLDLPI